ncbi:nitroreductase/NAD-dependent dihydropyrimidine dehydrogenase PreA subunit [Clostridium acetobutylicum]|uniref:Ferredoxin-like domain fused to nitroreductase-like domain n=1 Tax=Clostridium acetobutylicum (strain ATCC 824 / DSM 792 / JCM 1419 / IAM 19013 / LMG 5710 / NBRC 13948 / NRRL B-527 / VKM B-1787 / 2291 / W) TaxID=272562 RepID=Q97F22_CLOAB|nr:MULTISPECIES: nitroreductase family protein [Clostridium]AAK80875.1 Ferredoxin-like domain fused to nitroreductase-like domain [Clostridium acetobutylicum ATCC 824]ADZ21977.1 Ferredoxin-like domain fused to nitroreductase-like domain [Clostridium acetobutylicum EA 2018]AEI32613.1 ferredoxin-like domain-containing protein [Clostridium acetobutylicum DSM 1731]AWV78713.1 4Fe-4S dicluster domain-containing protein [Clostridium acetobutylicum]MBC2393576.1 4Fe-4S binding protein [Clostridium acet
MELIKVDRLKCKKCGICAAVCPSIVLGMEEDGPKELKGTNCIECGQCVAVCPSGAIDNVKTSISKQEELKEFPVIDEKLAELFLRSRRSIRCYKNVPVEDDKLVKLVNIAHFAPSASNSQNISYIVVKDKKILKKATEFVIDWMEAQIDNPSHWSFPKQVKDYREKGIDKILRDAPTLILGVAPKEFKNGRENTIFSFSYMELFATALGLGSCFAGLFEMCAFDNYEPLIDLFKLQENMVITGAVMVGYPKYKYKRLVDRNELKVSFIK